MTAQADGQRTRRLSALRQLVDQTPDLRELQALAYLVDSCKTDEDLERAFLGVHFFVNLRKRSQDTMAMVELALSRGMALQLIIDTDPSVERPSDRVDLQMRPVYPMAVAGRAGRENR